MTMRVTLSAPSESLTMGLRAVVERGGRFVEQEDARTAGHRAGNHDTLALTVGQRVDPLGDRRVQHGRR